MMTTAHIEKAWYLCRKRRRSDRIFCTIFIFSIPASRVSSNASMTTGLWACHSIAMSKCIKQQQQKLACITKTTTSQHTSTSSPHSYTAKWELYSWWWWLYDDHHAQRSLSRKRRWSDHTFLSAPNIYTFSIILIDPWVVLQQRWPLGFWACQLVLPIQVHQTEAKLG